MSGELQVARSNPSFLILLICLIHIILRTVNFYSVQLRFNGLNLLYNHFDYLFILIAEDDILK